jgi:hypothetical protein
LEQGERINLKPTILVTPVLVNLVKFHKQALIKYFKEKDIPKTTVPKLFGFHQIYDSDPLLKALLELGELICDYWNDSEAARTEIVADILSCPPPRRKALLAALGSSLRTKDIQVGKHTASVLQQVQHIHNHQQKIKKFT